MTEPKAVLVIAGSDSSGGAGIARDIRVLAHCGVDALCAVTAVTAQTNSRTGSVHHIPAASIRDQISAAFATRNIHAIKIGMLGTATTVTAVAASLFEPAPPIVIDPVLAASSGGVLLDSVGIESMRQLLLPRAALFTPNIPEAATLLDEAPATDVATMLEQAQRLLRMGPRAVLLKGGHVRSEEAVDVLVWGDGESLILASPRSAARRRGTGCAFASATAASLAHGASVSEACRSAKRYVVDWFNSPA
ncbi:MAG: bifunctional hydroxymethylpyrimidine kinase/phosphomethylpyrimidine kinase [Steroidobacter sp.]